MKVFTSKSFQVLLCCLLSLWNANPTHAGGPISLFDSGTPTLWGGGTFATFPIPYLKDQGPLGPLTKGEADALTTFSMNEWDAVSNSTFSVIDGGDTPFDITSANASNYLFTFHGAVIDVVYDHDGTICTAIFGCPPGVLGLGGPIFTGTAVPEIASAMVLMNGATIDPLDPGGAAYRVVFSQEAGHAIGLHHDQTNGAVSFFGDESSPTGCPSVGTPTFSDFTAMYPFADVTPFGPGAEAASIDHLEDLDALSRFHPVANYSTTTGTITGTVFQSDGITPVNGVNVIVRSMTNPFGDARSTITGDLDCNSPGCKCFDDPQCTPSNAFEGTFVITGLTPGVNYTLAIDNIVDGAFPQLPAPVFTEEYWNDTSESGNASTDNPCDLTPIIPTAGSTFVADFLLNAPDTTGPTVTINQAAGQTDPTNASPINFTVVFSEPMNDFATGDVTLGGTAGATTATVTEIAPNDGTTYNVAVSGMSQSGTVIATIPGGIATNSSGNNNTASTSTDNTVSFEILHTLTVNLAGTGGITINSTPNGIDCGSDCTEDYLEGTQVTLTATPSPGTVFSRWSGACTDTAPAPCIVTMTQAQTVTAHFLAILYPLDVALMGSGTGSLTTTNGTIDCPGVCQALFQVDSLVLLQAQPNPGSALAGWLGSGCTTESCWIRMDSPKTVTAIFEVAETLAVTLAGTGTGAVTSDSGAINCPDTCMDDFPINALVTLTGSPSSNSFLEGWNGCGQIVANTCQVTMDAAKNVTATFSPILQALNVNIASTPTYLIDMSLHSEPGDSIGQEQDWVITNSDLNNGTPTITYDVTGDGLVDGLGLAFNGPNFSSLNFNITSDELSTNLNPGIYEMAQRYPFEAPGHPGLSFTINGRSCNNANGSFHILDIEFNQLDLTRLRTQFVQQCESHVGALLGDIYFEANAGDGTGRVVSNPPGINCQGGCTVNYPQDTTVILTAIPDSGSTFTGWSGANCNGLGTCSVSMATAKNITATFSTSSQPTHSLTVTKQGSGVITSFPAGILCKNDCSEPYFPGTKVTLKGIADPGYIFEGWSGLCMGRGPCKVTMDAAKNVTATFSPIPQNTFPLTVSVRDPQVPFIELHVQSAPGDFVGQGQNNLFTNAEGRLSVTPYLSDFTGDGVTDRIRFSYTTSNPQLPSRWSLTLGTDKLGSNLATGNYSNAQRAAFANPGHPGLDFDMESRGCNTVTGNFTVSEFNSNFLESDRHINLLRAHFEQHCEDAVPALLGDIYLNGIAGDGAGNVTSDITGIDCGLDCTEFYSPGTMVILTASPLPGSIFTGWSGIGCSGSGTCTVTMTQAQQVWATFSKAFALNLTINGSGIVDIAPGSLSCSVSCSHEFTRLSEVTLSATPDPGTVFHSWSGGGCSGSNPTCVVSMDQLQNVTATFTSDTTGPAVTIEQEAGQLDPTNTSPINFTVVFNEVVTDFTTGDVTLGGTAGGTLLGTVTGSGTTYNVAVTGMTTDGTVTASIGSGVATDSFSNANSASTSTDNTVTYSTDTTGPTVTIDQAVGQPDPTNASPINFTVVFSEPVADFATGDVTLSGSAGATTATVTEIAPTDGTTYNIAVSGMAGAGTVIASISAGVAIDALGNGNALSTSTDNTVTYDPTPPVVTPPADSTVPAVDATGTPASATVIQTFLTSATATDNVEGNLTNAITHDAPAQFPLGATVVTFSVTDTAGNTGTAQATLTIADQTSPVLTPPGALAVLSPDGNPVPNTEPAIQAFLTGATATDNVEGTLTNAITHDAPAQFPLGATVVTFSVTDTAGNTSTAQATVTVTPPGGGPPVVAWEAATQNPSGVWNNSGVTNRTFRMLLQGAQITESGATVQLTLRGRTSGSYTLQRLSLLQRDGSTLNGVASTYQEVTFGSTWAAGVTVPAGATVTSDPIPFELVAGQDVFVTFWVPANNPTVYRNGGSGISFWSIANVDHTNTLDWTGLSTTSATSYLYALEQLEVITASGPDLIPPVITPPADSTVPAVDATGTPASATVIQTFLTSATATDNVEGNLTNAITHDAPAQFPLGATVVTFSVTDTAGNTGTAQATLTIADQTSPVLTPPGALAVLSPDGNPVPNTEPAIQAFLTGATATDNVEGTLTNAITHDAPAQFPLGATVVTFSVTDTAGNTSTAQATVTVTVPDLIPPVITPPADSTVPAVDATGTPASATVIQTFLTSATATDNVEGNLTNAITHDAPAQFPLGATVVTFSVTDTAGNTGTAQATLTIADQTSPVLTPPGALAVLSPDGNPVPNTEPAIQAFLTGATATDNVEGTLTNAITHDAPAQFPLGATVVTFSVTDTAGNTSTAQATVTVTPPGGGPPVVAWEAATQNPSGVWNNSGVTNRTFRMLLQGAQITESGATVQLTLRGRTSGSYTLQRLSLLQRDGSTLNGVASTYQEVTFGSTWAAGVTVPAGATVTSDPIPFELVAGQDVFVTFWVPANNPTVYRNGGSGISFWSIANVDHTNTLDWTGLSTTSATSYLYALEQLEVITASGPDLIPPVITPPADSTVPAVDATGTPASATVIQTFLTSATATDNVEGNLTNAITHDAPAQFPLGATVVTFSVTDTAGNTGTAQATLTIADQTSPVLTPPGALAVLSPDGNPVPNTEPAIQAFLTGATATDNVEGTLTNAITHDAPAQFPLGATVVTFSVTDTAGNTSTAQATVTVTPPGGGPPVVAWEAATQNPSGVWNNSGVTNRTFRMLLQGAQITESGATVQLTLRGRTSGSYTLQRLSLLQRDGSTLNGVASTYQEVTFGSTWAAGVTVPAGATVTSDPIPFELVAGQDVFVTFWVPANNPTVYRNGGSGISFWSIANVDHTNTLDWTGLSTTSATSYLYALENLEVVP
ncbi:InlB B-repeat-containing protein [Candidatus Nitronereus thalassa]|uniref:HYR domain-containing protein n=1 Tax=Candidatus Nitronereus thalassa TaxID=3020898 RepID=A0ABU3K4E2_9BACT|nr:HYR domain-containing protein [Candidatus Nitronereus thalassa]MDT7041244.1 HYR domain-containing protein [Candidatus Nitronereus thalassa]